MVIIPAVTSRVYNGQDIMSMSRHFVPSQSHSSPPNNMDNQDVPLQFSEDQWSGISDAQMRKRIQNRLAQRRHRKKVRELGTQTFVLDNCNQVSGAPVQSIELVHAEDLAVDQALAWLSPHSNVPICTPSPSSGITPSTIVAETPCLSRDLEQSVTMCLDDPMLATSMFPYLSLDQPSDESLLSCPSTILDDIGFSLSSHTLQRSSLPRNQRGVADIGRDAAYIDVQSYDCSPSHIQTMPTPRAAGEKTHGDQVSTVGDNQTNRFHSILVFLKSLGFATVDDMVVEYYTAHFPEGSHVAQAQQFSRQRNLRRLLVRIQAASGTWNQRDRTTYRDQNSLRGRRILPGRLPWANETA